MDWNLLLDTIANVGVAAAPFIASALMIIVGTLFYRLTGLLPGFVRTYIEKAYREKEALFRDSITKALVNGITAAVARGRKGHDALSEAIDHAIKNTPDAVAHFKATSNMDRQTLATMAEKAAVDLGIKLEAETVIAPVDPA